MWRRIRMLVRALPFSAFSGEPGVPAIFAGPAPGAAPCDGVGMLALALFGARNVARDVRKEHVGGETQPGARTVVALEGHKDPTSGQPARAYITAEPADLRVELSRTTPTGDSAKAGLTYTARRFASSIYPAARVPSLGIGIGMDDIATVAHWMTVVLFEVWRMLLGEAWRSPISHALPHAVDYAKSCVSIHEANY
ncbi:hypothetical protein C8Q79DRAFT_925472 [Trametes meyenii]|nr:hypothetical protein C8Q79DRAFT_925472 [Trametes meyenii]